MSVGCSSTAQAPGPNQGPVTPVPVLRPELGPWVRRLLFTALLVVSGWLLFVATSGVARADDGTGGPCATAPLAAPAGDDVALPDSALAHAATSAVCPLVPAPDPPAVIDTPAPEPPAPVVPAPPAAAPVVDVPAVVPEAPPADVPVPAAAEAPGPVASPVTPPPAAVDVPVVDVPAPQPVATPQPAATAPDKPAPAPAVQVVQDPVADAPAPPADVVACARPDAATLVVGHLAAAPVVSGAGIAPPSSAVTPAPGVPRVPPRTPAPLDLPLQAPAPVCPTAGAGSGASGCGTGHGQHTHADHVVLGSRFVSPTEAGPAQAVSSAADEAVGATDDPGTRPG